MHLLFVLSTSSKNEIEECLRLQGLPTLLHQAAIENGISNHKLMGAVGNSWPVNVVVAILRKIKVSMDWHWFVAAGWKKSNRNMDHLLHRTSSRSPTSQFNQTDQNRSTNLRSWLGWWQWPQLLWWLLLLGLEGGRWVVNSVVFIIIQPPKKLFMGNQLINFQINTTVYIYIYIIIHIVRG